MVASAGAIAGQGNVLYRHILQPLVTAYAVLYGKNHWLSIITFPKDK
jgi:hypothetical protein